MTSDAQPARRLVGVGVGPGDPELVTLKAVRVLREADVVLVPVMGTGEPGRAEATVLAHVEATRTRRVVFALNERDDATRREQAWDAAARSVAEAFEAGVGTVAFATLGDPNVYSTFTYLAETVRGLVPEVVVETVPGVTAMQDLAARSGTVLAEGRESLALLPLTAGLATFENALAHFDSVVAYKGGRQMPDVLRVLREAGRLDGAVYGAALGLDDEDVRPAADLPDAPAPYLSTVVVPARRRARGGKL
ncbi:MAG: precorrin-2 C(20)-methyltransferase [Actinomycetes bacterium]